LRRGSLSYTPVIPHAFNNLSQGHRISGTNSPGSGGQTHEACHKGRRRGCLFVFFDFTVRFQGKELS